MKFRAHETFFIRKGWLAKGLKNIILEPGVFMGASGNPMDVFGIGTSMIKALRYWMQAVGLAIEPAYGKKEQILTELGEIINENDKYVEELATIWLLHYKLTTNKENATAWYYFFNEFKLKEFTKEDFILHMRNYLKMNNKDVSLRALEDDFDCIINSYVSRIRLNPAKIQPESNIDSPFTDLGLIDVISKKDKRYRKTATAISSLQPMIAFALMLDQIGVNKEFKISELLYRPNSIGLICNLDIISLMDLLYRIERLGYIKVSRTAGLDVIKILKNITFEAAIKEYYKSIAFVNSIGV